MEGDQPPDWTVPVRVRTKEMTFLRESVVRNRSVFNGSVYCDGDMDCGPGVVPRFVMIQIVNILTMWAATRTVWTKLYWRAVLITRLGRCHLNRFVLLRMI